MNEFASHSVIAPKLIDSLYLEAMVLADEARSYFDRNGQDDRAALDPLGRVAFSCESLKVTTRLMHVVSWLLVRRAVEAGELNAHQAQGRERRLGDASTSDDSALKPLPERARELVRASDDLYKRVQRLERELEVGQQAIPSPARSLLDRLERSL
ncbi:MAG: DUF1465 family protein [Novosphingobium sp.]|nr:DUF1465 family protein [Novosphingobium sp.]